MGMSQKSKHERAKLRQFEAKCNLEKHKIRFKCLHKGIDLSYKTVMNKCKIRNKGIGCSKLCRIEIK